MKEYDIIIAGGGMVGATLAVALAGLKTPAGQPLRLALVEAHAPDRDIHPGFDTRAIALAHGSCMALRELGLMQASGTPIHHIHVSDRGHPGRLELHAAEYRLPAWGQVVELQQMGLILYGRLQALANVDLWCPASVTRATTGETGVSLSLADGQQLGGALLIGADGGDSRLRQWLGLEVEQQDYGQSAIIATLQCDRHVAGWAWERFTDSGPLALLPLSGDRYSMVWTVRPSQALELMDLDDETFLGKLQQAFGFRAGRFVRVGARACYPLCLQQVGWPIGRRGLLVGNAAHQLHPVAGQGFNLGLRDVMALRQTLARALAEQRDLGAYAVLREYWRHRENDQARTIWLTSSLALLFADQSWPLVGGRNLLLGAMSRCRWLREPLLHQTLGLESS